MVDMPENQTKPNRILISTEEGKLYTLKIFTDNIILRHGAETSTELKITLVYKNKFLVWGKNGNRCFLLIWVCWIQIYK